MGVCCAGEKDVGNLSIENKKLTPSKPGNIDDIDAGYREEVEKIWETYDKDRNDTLSKAEASKFLKVCMQEVTG